MAHGSEDEAHAAELGEAVGEVVSRRGDEHEVRRSVPLLRELLEDLGTELPLLHDELDVDVRDAVPAGEEGDLLGVDRHVVHRLARGDDRRRHVGEDRETGGDRRVRLLAVFGSALKAPPFRGWAPTTSA
jgi:hypothetical protein